MRQQYAATPLGMGFGQSRFASPGPLHCSRPGDGGAEADIRGRFDGKSDRTLHLSEIAGWAVSEVSATSPLTVIDVRTTGLLRLGIRTDAARAKFDLRGYATAPA